MTPLSPLRIRLAAFATLALIALVAIWFIDRRAMQRQAELEAAASSSAPSVRQSLDQSEKR